MPIVTVKQKVKVNQKCRSFPLYLNWLNKLGGRDQFLFFNSHKEIHKTKLVSKHIKYVADLETSLGQIDIAGKTSEPRIDFGAYALEADMDGIMSLYESSNVMLLTNPNTWKTDGPNDTPLPKWIRVLIRPGSLLRLKTDQKYMEVKMSMTLPLINIQNQ